MGKREPQTIDDPQHSPGDPRDGKLTAKSAGCVETLVFLEGDESRSR